MQTWKDDDFLLSFKFSRVEMSRKGFYELFGQWSADKMAAYFFALEEIIVNLSLVFCSM